MQAALMNGHWFEHDKGMALQPKAFNAVTGIEDAFPPAKRHCVPPTTAKPADVLGAVLNERVEVRNTQAAVSSVLEAMAQRLPVRDVLASGILERLGMIVDAAERDARAGFERGLTAAAEDYETDLFRLSDHNSQLLALNKQIVQELRRKEEELAAFQDMAKSLTTVCYATSAPPAKETALPPACISSASFAFDERSSLADLVPAPSPQPSGSSSAGDSQPPELLEDEGQDVEDIVGILARELHQGAGERMARRWHQISSKRSLDKTLSVFIFDKLADDDSLTPPDGLAPPDADLPSIELPDSELPRMPHDSDGRLDQLAAVDGDVFPPADDGRMYS